MVFNFNIHFASENSQNVQFVPTVKCQCPEMHFETSNLTGQALRSQSASAVHMCLVFTDNSGWMWCTLMKTGEYLADWSKSAGSDMVIKVRRNIKKKTVQVSQHHYQYGQYTMYRYTSLLSSAQLLFRKIKWKWPDLSRLFRWLFKITCQN